MLSYQHAYHAGSFADVIKHVALTRLLDYLVKKEKPLFYLETHSGRGIYDLKDAYAQKTKEYQEGIGIIWQHKDQLPPVFGRYIDSISQLNPKGGLQFYPGSPYLALTLLRPQDRLYCCELHPQEFDILRTMPHRNKRIHRSESDGMAALKALVPPQENRGLVFIDPSFEVKDEYKRIPAAIKQAYERFSQGVFCLWYPVINSRFTDKLARAMDTIPAANTLRLEFKQMDSKEGMRGCGLWIINPTYGFAEEMTVVLDVLKKHFNPECSQYTMSSR